MGVYELLERVNSIRIDEILFEIMESLEKEIIALNLSQLDVGFNKDGEALQRYVAGSYASIKNLMNVKPGFWNPDLKLTGSFWSKFKIEVTPQVTEIFSTDPKHEHLSEKYKNIYGLMPEHMNEIIDIVLNRLIAAVRKKLNLE